VIAYTPALDGLRGLAILLVLFHHFTILKPATAVDQSLADAALIGWSGVDLFFVLSGFLITGILIDARGSDRYFRSFYARRTLRIFPLYYLIVFLSLIVLPRLPAWFDLLAGAGAPREQWPYWLYLTNFAVASRDAFRHGVLDVTWSLAIEEQFYLVWAVVVWLCPPRILGALCALTVAGAPFARTLALQQGAEPIDVYVLTQYRADALATGALIAWLLRRGWLHGQGGAGLALAAAALVGVIGVCWADGSGWWANAWMQRAGYSLLSLTGAGMLVAAVVQPPTAVWPRILSAGWLRAFGKYSYCLYLIHLPVMRIVRAFVLAPGDFAMFGPVWAGQLVFYAAATIPAFALAWMSWRVFEAPILKLKARFPY
jgi:peptidoglycan/LPS O-acetylase OafA/YrhL